jgi:hypothetical protein
MCGKMRRKMRRYNHRIGVYRPSQVVPVDVWLPAGVSRCVGLQALLVGVAGTDRDFVPVAGEYSLEFGGKQSHPVQFHLSYVSPQAVGEELDYDRGMLPLSEVVSDQRLVTGYYLDTGEWEAAVFVPYEVVFTFHLEA